jgi:hypothetical protein
MSRTTLAPLAALGLTLLAGSGRAAGPASDPAALLRRADAPHDAFSEGVIRLRVTVVEHGKAPVENLLDLYVQGGDRSLCIFREGKQKGRKILTVGERVWLIVPNTARPVPVTKSQRLMGAASFGDIARMRFADEYDAKVGAQQEKSFHVLDLTAKRKGAAYPKAVLWIGRGSGLPQKLRLSLASGKEAKEVAFTGYGKDMRLAGMEIRDLLAAGADNTTSLAFESYEPKTLDPSIFDPEGARAIP